MLRPNLAQKTVVYGVGIADEKVSFKGISVYPTLTKDLVYLDLNFDGEKNIHYSITDQMGRCMKSEEISQVKSKVEKIDVSSFPSGIYIINISDNKHLFHQKMVKN